MFAVAQSSLTCSHSAFVPLSLSTCHCNLFIIMYLSLQVIYPTAMHTKPFDMHIDWHYVFCSQERCGIVEALSNVAPRLHLGPSRNTITLRIALPATSFS